MIHHNCLVLQHKPNDVVQYRCVMQFHLLWDMVHELANAACLNEPQQEHVVKRQRVVT